MLACLHWLGQFQILAFIATLGSIAIKDIADLADVPENKLGRIVRMTAAAGFLHGAGTRFQSEERSNVENVGLVSISVAFTVWYSSASRYSDLDSGPGSCVGSEKPAFSQVMVSLVGLGTSSVAGSALRYSESKTSQRKLRL